MKLPFERPEEPEIYITNGVDSLLFFINKEKGKVTVPLAYDGVAVSKIGSATYAEHTSIKQVTIPEGITEIG